MGISGGKILLRDLTSGIYLVTPGGLCELAFPYVGGDFHLADIFEYFELGEVLEEDGVPGIELDSREIKQLQTKARDYARDHPPEFIAMCQALVHSVLTFAVNEEIVCFYENF